MHLLNRYLLGQFFKFFLTVAAGFIALYLLIDFFEKFDNFTEAGKPLSVVIKYFLFSIPAIVDQLGPILILLSGVISLGVLNSSNELTALKAGGLPLRAIIRPIIIGGGAVTLLFMASAQWILPSTVAVTNDIWIEGVQGKTPVGIVRNNRYYYHGQEGFYSFAWKNNKEYLFANFSYSSWDKEYGLKEMISATSASWDAKQNSWLLKGGVLQQQESRGSYTTTTFTSRKFHFPETPEAFRTPQHAESERSLSALLKGALNNQIAFEAEEAWGLFLGRISYILLGLPLLLLGLPILLLSYQKWGKDLSIAIPASCTMAFSAWAVWGALQSLAIAGKFSPWLAAFLIHAIFITLGLYLLRRFDQ
ncbi:LptF/LptG family permease [Desulfotalea psychrophila]|uniref:Permease n=1 Tax=Desulfotalea psychrophila (strain LSv54 / DSM 12343) TaxID=177439 RepID=Q6AP27_DESPS|nr:LptF/LptG family permease [Desulfotalea psychrophila]CAG35897.1 unknown protein [Desulfotalea psychrophila LSv54]